MVKVLGPAFSMDASGSLAGALVFSKWKGRNYIRQLVTPANPKSGGQVGMRAAFKFLTQQWASLSAPNQATWEDRADDMVASAFNAYLSYNQKRWRNFKGMSKDDPAIDTADGSTLGVLSVAASERSITVTQAVTVAGNAWGICIFRSPTTTFDTAWNNLIAIEPVDGTEDVVHVDSPLDPGDYYYDTRPLIDDGLLGAETGEETDTVV